jgi:opacity protein-like surface antigen
MKKTVLALACTALATPLVFAQAKNFEGFSLGANLSSAKTTFDSTALGATDGTTNSVDLNAQYNFALGQDFVLGVGVSAGTGSNKAGNYANGTELNTKNRYALEFTPGFALSKDVLVYGKIASLGATAEAGGNSESISGVGYGLGLRGMVDKNMYWQVGYDLNQYGEKDDGAGGTYKVKSNVFSLGLGYKF